MNEKGFTFIELILVVAILSIMGLMAVSQYTYYKKESFNAVTNADFRNSMTGLEAYMQDHDGNYPTCNAASCEETLPGFKQSEGVQVSFNGVDDTSITGVACHAKGDMRLVFTGIPGLIIGMRTGPCGS